MSPDGQSIPKTLLRAGGSQRVLDLWLEQIRECARLRPVEEKVLIVVNADHAAAYEAWARACGFPVANIINNGAPRCATVVPCIGMMAHVGMLRRHLPCGVRCANAANLLSAVACHGQLTTGLQVAGSQTPLGQAFWLTSRWWRPSAHRTRGCLRRTRTIAFTRTFRSYALWRPRLLAGA